MKVRSLGECTRVRCPFCAATVVCDPRSRTIHHAGAPCDGFGKAMVSFGLSLQRAEPCVWIDEEALSRRPAGVGRA